MGEPDPYDQGVWWISLGHGISSTEQDQCELHEDLILCTWVSTHLWRVCTQFIWGGDSYFSNISGNNSNQCPCYVLVLFMKCIAMVIAPFPHWRLAPPHHSTLCR